MSSILFRRVVESDLDQIFPLLQQLTHIDYSARDKEKCWQLFKTNTAVNSLVGVDGSKIVAYGSIVIENKIRGDISGHIEDIVVDTKARGRNIGTELIKHLIEIGEKKNCYRITLFCDETLIDFYSNNGFKVNNIAMKRYTHEF